MRILAVDDRPEGLARMETLARELSPEAELLSSASSLEALGMARKAEIDLALLRVETPELGGLDPGRYLIELNPLVNLIYVSEDERHGFEAMDIHASGYVLFDLEYTYDQEKDQYTMTNGEALQQEAQQLYNRYARWLENFSLSK